MNPSYKSNSALVLKMSIHAPHLSICIPMTTSSPQILNPAYLRTPHLHDPPKPVCPAPSPRPPLPLCLSPSMTTLSTPSPTTAPAASSLPPAAVALAARMFDAARRGQMDIFQQALPAGLPATLTNDKGDSLVSRYACLQGFGAISRPQSHHPIRPPPFFFPIKPLPPLHSPLSHSLSAHVLLPSYRSCSHPTTGTPPSCASCSPTARTPTPSTTAARAPSRARCSSTSRTSWMRWWRGARIPSGGARARWRVCGFFAWRGSMRGGLRGRGGGGGWGPWEME